jgi:hypothetical protein
LCLDYWDGLAKEKKVGKGRWFHPSELIAVAVLDLL